MSDHRSRAEGARPRSTAELRAQIQHTRARLAADIDVAREKLSPRGLQREALDSLRGARRGASGALDELGDATGQRAAGLRDIAVDAIKRYPVVTTLVGLGLAWLVLGNGSRRNETPPDADLPAIRPEARADLPPPRA